MRSTCLLVEINNKQLSGYLSSRKHLLMGKAASRSSSRDSGIPTIPSSWNCCGETAPCSSICSGRSWKQLSAGETSAADIDSRYQQITVPFEFCRLDELIFKYLRTNKSETKPKHGSSDGRAGASRLKVPDFIWWIRWHVWISEQVLKRLLKEC